ncbi:MAG: hypothetical protein PHC34_13845 [Candidatus Gastranaerophilales bacterium]|nr:hypothetical protein [Candidatus Gastranaerophilales bacterium]
MAKAINWPQELYEEIINEDSDNPRIALRIGDLYFNNGYFVDNEIVDIRVDHKIIRKAVIIDDLKLFKIKELPENLILFNKNQLRSKFEIISFLSRNYNQPVDEETLVTVVTYRNLPIEKKDVLDDPHSD